jgi:hypothetical protein
MIFKPTDQAGTKTSNHELLMIHEQFFSPYNKFLQIPYRKEEELRHQIGR